MNKLKRQNENNYLNSDNNVNTDANLNDIEEKNKNVNNDFSERKNKKKTRTFRKNDVLIEEKNEINIYNSKESKSIKKEIIEQEIEEEKQIVNEKVDKQTSYKSIKHINNKNEFNYILQPFKINSFTFESKYLTENARDDIDKENEIHYSEQYNIIKNKFDELYDNSNEKIKSLVSHLNKLINNMNKVIFNQKDSINLTKGRDYINEEKPRKLFINNSRKNFSLPLNTSFDNKRDKTLKEKENIKESLKHKLKNNFFIDKKYINENIKVNNTEKINELRADSNDIVNLFEEKGKYSKDYYIRMLRLSSVNKIENYLIKKFTEPN